MNQATQTELKMKAMKWCVLSIRGSKNLIILVKERQPVVTFCIALKKKNGFPWLFTKRWCFPVNCFFTWVNHVHPSLGFFISIHWYRFISRHKIVFSGILCLEHIILSQQALEKASTQIMSFQTTDEGILKFINLKLQTTSQYILFSPDLFNPIAI